MTTLYTFNARMCARPAEATPASTVELRGLSLAVLHVPLSALGTPFPLTFETAAERLPPLGRLDFEPDGYFLWSGNPDWQVDGHLFDRDDRLLFVDLKGSCSAEKFDQLLSVFDWPATPLVFQLVEEGVTLAEPEFRAFAAAMPSK